MGYYMVLYGVIWCYMVLYDIIYYHILSYTIIYYHILSYTIIYYHITFCEFSHIFSISAGGGGMLYMGCYMVLYGVIWCYMVLYGVIWCYMVLYGVVWCYMWFGSGVWAALEQKHKKFKNVKSPKCRIWGKSL